MSPFLCPTCRKPVAEPPADAPMGNFPFCSDRCKVVDLARWADEKYQVPVVEANADDEAGPGPRRRGDEDDLP